ncbi:alpha-glucosidase [Microbacterium chocolatum]|uniref:alpha-glucosidase n=1 Tax=Microbacterium aurantiacum TaxID=162393 RepID=UPI003390329E
MSAEYAWWTSAVVYQIYPRSFQDSDGDGIGDLRGILRRVDHLAELGVDVVWFSPLYRSPQDDNGYDISDYQDVDPLFGTLDDLDEVIEALHHRGIKVVMDLVVNHTSDEHPWFVESRSSRDSPKRDWYWWRDPRDGFEPGTRGSEPTNWGSFFSGPAWEWDEQTGQYYLHLFSRKQPDLNWENPEVREAVYAMMRWWLDRGVDGFRMDVINLISKDVGPEGALSDAPVASGLYGDATAASANGPRLHEFLQEMHREVFAGRRDSLLLVGETPGATVEDARLFTDPARAELDMVFTFEHMGLDTVDGDRFQHRPLDLRDLKATLTRWQTGLAETGWNSLYWDNHDQPRVVSRFGDDGEHRVASAKALATVLHLHRGTPYIYQGEELGMTDAGFTSFDQYRDIESLRYVDDKRAIGEFDDEQLLRALAFGSRDNARTPVQWDGSVHAGFTKGEPWIEVNPNHDRINAEDARADPASVFHYYRRLIALRHDDPVVQTGTFTLVWPEDTEVYAFHRAQDGIRLTLVANCSSEGVERDAGDLGIGRAGVAIATHDDPPQAPSGRLRLRPWECVVYRVEDDTV